MFLEVPNMAAADAGGRARVISRTFRKYHDIYDRQVFTGPPEQTRDYVMTATKVRLTSRIEFFYSFASSRSNRHPVVNEGRLEEML